MIPSRKSAKALERATNPSAAAFDSRTESRRKREENVAAAAMMDDLADRLTYEAVRIMGTISVRWGIDDDTVARLAGTNEMAYLRRLNGYEDRPFTQDIVHRITALGLIDRSLAVADPEEWANTPAAYEPFNGRAPVEAMMEMDIEALVALNVRMGEINRRPTEISLPTL